MPSHLKVLLSFLKASTSTMLSYRQPGDNRSRSLGGGRKKDAGLSLRDQRYIILTRLRKEIDENMLADMLQLRQYSISRLIITWIHFIHLRLPRNSVNITLLHLSFSVSLRFNANCRIFPRLYLHMQMHIWLAMRSILHCTLKILVGIRAVLFISSLFTGKVQ